MPFGGRAPSHHMRCLRGVAIALGSAFATGCSFSGFSEPQLDNTLFSLTVVPMTDTLFADGASQAAIVVALDSSLADGTAVRIQVTTGILFGASADSTAVSVSATGRNVEVQYRTGVRPGEVFVQALVAGLVRDTILQAGHGESG